MPVRETQSALTARPPAEVKLVFSVALAPELSLERARRRAALLHAGDKNVEIYQGPKDAPPADDAAAMQQAVLRARHCIIRSMAENFVVPLSNIDGPTGSDITIIRNYEVAEVLAELHIAIQNADGLLTNRLPLPPRKSNDDMEVDEPTTKKTVDDDAFEATTLDIWLAPRLLSAAAMLLARIAELQGEGPSSSSTEDAQDTLARLERIHRRLCDTLHLVLDMSARTHGPIHINFICEDLRRVAERTIDLFSPSRTAQMEATDVVKFYDGTVRPDQSLRMKALPPRSKVPMNEAWLPEDHSPFTVALHPNIGSSSQNVTRRSFYYAHALLSCTTVAVSRLSMTHPQPLVTINEMLLNRLHQEWDRDLLTESVQLPRRPLPLAFDAQRIAVFETMARQLDQNTSSPIGQQMFAFMADKFCRTFMRDVLSDVPAGLQLDQILSASRVTYFDQLQRTMHTLRGSVCVTSNGCHSTQPVVGRILQLMRTVVPPLRRCLSAFVEVACEGWELNIVEASAMQFGSHEKDSKTLQMLHKNCAFEAIMVILSDISPLHAHSIGGELDALEKLCGEDLNATALREAANAATMPQTLMQEVEEHTWLSQSNRVELLSTVQRYRQCRTFVPTTPPRTATRDPTSASQSILAGKKRTADPSDGRNGKRAHLARTGDDLTLPRHVRLLPLSKLEEMWQNEAEQALSHGPDQLLKALELVGRAFCAAAGQLRLKKDPKVESSSVRHSHCAKCDSIAYAVIASTPEQNIDSGSDAIRRCCSKAGFSTVLRLFENVATILPANEKAAPLLDGVRRCFAHGGESLLLDHALRAARTIVQKGMRHVTEAGRTAAVRLCTVMVRQASASQLIASRPEIMETIEQMIDSALVPQTDPRLKMPTLMLACQLAKVDNILIQRRGIAALALTLDTSSLTGDLAVDFLLQVQRYHHKTMIQLLSPHWAAIAPVLIANHAKGGEGLKALLRLLELDIEVFFRIVANETVPVLVAEANVRAVETIASTLKIPRAQMCIDTLAPHIMSHILLKPAEQRDRALEAFITLATEANNRSGPPIDALLRCSLTDVLAHLLLGLGDEKTRDIAKESLVFVERSLAKSSNRAVTEQKALANLISGELRPIQYWMTEELRGSHGKRTMPQRARVLGGIGALVEVVGSSINAVRPQILTALTSALSTKELRLDALRAWNQLFTKLPFGDVAPVVGQTAAAVLDWWPQFSAAEKEVATGMLRFAILLHGDDLGTAINGIPSLDALESEIPDIARKLRSYRIRQATSVILGHILERVGSDNASVSYHSLQDLQQFLLNNRPWIELHTSGNSFGTEIGAIVTMVLAAASRLEDEHSEARNVCLRCLGILGAIDPDRFDSANEDQSRIILKNFEDKDESAEFGIYTIQTVLVSTFRNAIDGNAQNSYAFAIQEMLKYCGLSKISAHGEPPSVAARERWKAFPTSMLDVLQPLSGSKFIVVNAQHKDTPTPLYQNTPNFRTWIVQWARQLICHIRQPEAATFFNIVRFAIWEHDVHVARFILPHLVLHVLISGPEDRRSDIRSELIAVLNDQVEETNALEEDRRQQSAQIVFQLLDHLNVFIRRKRLETIHRSSRKARQPELSEALVNVESIIASIPPELMARASLRCRSYARALLSFETRVRTMKSEAGRGDSDLQEYYASMHGIYANVDEPDGMEGISTKILNPSLEHQIREHEMTGRWTSAQSCWEVKLQQEPESLDSQLGLLRCLRSLGHFDNLRTHIRGILTKHPEWRDSLAAFTLESSWSLGQWDDVAESVSHVQDPLPEHGIGKAFLCMREDDQVGFRAAVQEARGLVGRPIFTAGGTKYAQVVDSITQLHMLHELEMIQAVPKNSQAGSGQVTDLLQSLRARYHSSVPSFRTREALLSLRRSAFGVRGDSPDLIAEVGRCWTTTSKIARKAGHMQTAYSAVLQAIREKAPSAFVQNAKLLASNGDVQHALREVDTALHLQSKNFRLPGTDPDTAGGTAADAIDLTDSPRPIKGASEPSKLSAIDIAKACLLRARLMELAGRFESNDVIGSYKQSSKADQKAEKSWYFLGRYYDSLREGIPFPMQYKGFVIRFFLKAAMSGTKYFYRTIPRIATIWLDAGEDHALVKASKSGRPVEKRENYELYQKQEMFQQINDKIRKTYPKIAAYQWYGIFPQLVSRVIHKHEGVSQILQELIGFVVKNFPEQAMWSMVAGVQSKDEERSRRMMRILSRVKGDAGRDGNAFVGQIVDRTQKLAEQLLILSEIPVKSANHLTVSHHIPILGSSKDFQSLLIPLQDSIVVNLPTDFSARSDHQGFPSQAPRIRGFEERIDVMSSLQKPRKLGIKGTDGRLYNFLCKPKDDLRKDARLMEFDSMINKFLQSNAESRRRQLHIRTYAVVTLNEECGFIEWVPNTIGFRQILTTLYSSRGISVYTPDVKPLLDEARLHPDPRKSAEMFESLLARKYPPVFHEWFLATFSEPTAWMKARLSYARTAAVMSMVGWVLGLGDRHGENILFDATNGDTVHVDFNCLFEKGQTFEIPEKVPFRLTQNLVDALGVTGVEGVFRRACEITMNILRENKDSLMSVLDAMIHDPLVDFGSADDARRKARHGGSSTNGERLDPRVVAARQNLAPIERKLEGFMVSKLDTRPPAHSTGIEHGLVGATGSTAAPTGTDGRSGRYGAAASKTPVAGHPTNELVDMLIREATSSVLLSKMYVGWAPYL
ncbi:hypothetical protein OC845_000897 [Tilletia horrida]|nr:hypothetical protein OC845_000897 [Tilletia horrida]